MDASARPTRRCPLCFVDVPSGAQCSGCAPYRHARPDPTALQPGSLLAEQYLIGRVAGEPGESRATYLGWDARLERRVRIEEYLPRHLAVRAGDGTTLLPYTEEHRPFFEAGLDDFLRAARSQARSGPEPASDLFTANGTAYSVTDLHARENLTAPPAEPPVGEAASQDRRSHGMAALAIVVLLLLLAVLLLRREPASSPPVALADTVDQAVQPLVPHESAEPPPPESDGATGEPGGGSPDEGAEPGEPDIAPGEPDPPSAEPGGTPPGEPDGPPPDEPGQPPPGAPPPGEPEGMPPGDPGPPPTNPLPEGVLPTPPSGTPPPPVEGGKPGAPPGTSMPPPTSVLSRAVIGHLQEHGYELTKWLLYEDFSSNRRGWTLQDRPGGHYLALHDGRAYIMTREQGRSFRSGVRVPHRDVAIRFDLRFESGIENSGAGVALRYDDRSPQLVVVIDSGGNARHFLVALYDPAAPPGQNWRDLTPWMRTDGLIRQGQNTVEVVVTGGTLSLFINGTFARTVTGIPERDGEWLGLTVAHPNMLYSFDNLLVMALEQRQ